MISALNPDPQRAEESQCCILLGSVVDVKHIEGRLNDFRRRLRSRPGDDGFMRREPGVGSSWRSAGCKSWWSFSLTRPVLPSRLPPCNSVPVAIDPDS
jgi:hypothetical protein